MYNIKGVMIMQGDTSQNKLETTNGTKADES